MTDDDLRIAMAECLGWKWYKIPKGRFDDHEYRMLALPAIHEYEGQSEAWTVRADGSEKICNMTFMEANCFLPNYPKSLDAMHDAEETLNEREWYAYCEYLRQARPIGEFGPIHATARQRAEAFLGVKGRRKE